MKGEVQSLLGQALGYSVEERLQKVHQSFGISQKLRISFGEACVGEPLCVKYQCLQEGVPVA